jgi:hypothetical protein
LSIAEIHHRIDVIFVFISDSKSASIDAVPQEIILDVTSFIGFLLFPFLLNILYINQGLLLMNRKKKFFVLLEFGLFLV